MNDGVPTKTVCAGRFAVDIPSSAKIRMDALYHGIRTKVERPAVNFTAINDAVASQAKKYQAVETERNAGDDAFLRAAGLDPAKALSPTQLVATHINRAHQQAIIAYHTRPNSLEVTAELHALIDAHEWVFTITQSSAGDFDHDSATLSSIASHFKPIQKQMTTLPGFCVLGGVFTDARKPGPGENMTLAINDPAHKDMDLTIESNDSIRPSSESAREEIDRDLAMLRTHIRDLKILSRGEQKAAGQNGYLIAITGTDPDLGGARFYKFYWKASGTPHAVTKPSMDVELLTHPRGVAQGTFKDSDAVVAYFDRILQSIRVRGSAH